MILSIIEGEKQVKELGIIRREILKASETDQQWEKDRVHVPEVMVQDRTFTRVNKY
jgi:hypothetical protein